MWPRFPQFVVHVYRTTNSDASLSLLSLPARWPLAMHVPLYSSLGRHQQTNTFTQQRMHRAGVGPARPIPGDRSGQLVGGAAVVHPPVENEGRRCGSQGMYMLYDTSDDTQVLCRSVQCRTQFRRFDTAEYKEPLVIFFYRQ